MEIEFPDDLPIEILSHMPAKSVIRSKSASKAWLDFISDASFRRLHSQRSKPVLSGFFFQERFESCEDDIESLNYIPLSGGVIYHTVLDFLPEKVVIAASSNGLLCCRSCTNSPNPVIYVCNPCNKEYVPIKGVVPNKVESLAVAFDHPLNISMDFKLVSVHKAETDSGFQFSFQIFSSKTRQWWLAKDVCLCIFSLSKKKGVFAGGVLYWLTNADQILAFDLKNEQPSVIDVPPSMQCKAIPAMCIGESEGHLHYIQISEVGLEDWVLKDYSEGKGCCWSLKQHVSLVTMAEEYPEFLYNIAKRVASRVSANTVPYMDPLSFKDGLVLMTVYSKIYSYELETRKMKELCSLCCLGPNSLQCPIVLPYSLSLVPLTRP